MMENRRVYLVNPAGRYHYQRDCSAMHMTHSSGIEAHRVSPEPKSITEDIAQGIGMAPCKRCGDAERTEEMHAGSTLASLAALTASMNSACRLRYPLNREVVDRLCQERARGAW